MAHLVDREADGGRQAGVTSEAVQRATAADAHRHLALEQFPLLAHHALRRHGTVAEQAIKTAHPCLDLGSGRIGHRETAAGHGDFHQ